MSSTKTTRRKVIRVCKCAKCAWQWVQKYPTARVPVRCPNHKCRTELWNQPERLKVLERLRRLREQRMAEE